MTVTRGELDALRLQLALEVDERVERGMCGCGCPERLPVNRGRRRYVNERHKQKAYRQRLEREAEALGVPTRLSLARLQRTNPTRDRRADGQSAASGRQRRQSRPRPGLTVYVPTVDAAIVLLTVFDDLAQVDGREDLVAFRDALKAALKRRASRP